MIDPARVQFPKVNKTFLKGLFWLVVFLFLASIFSSARGIYDRFLRKPEVRKEVIQLGRDAYRGNWVFIQRAIIIHNRGNDDAKNIFIQCLIPNGNVTRLHIISEEKYTDNSTVNPLNTCSYSLDRLSAGAKFILLLWSTVSTTDYSNNREPVMPIVSAAFDGGVAISSDMPTALEEVQELGNTLTKGTSVITRQVNQKIRVDILFYWLITSFLPSWGIYFTSKAANSQGFTDALITIIMIIAAGWLLLPRVWAGVLVGLLFSLLLWLFVDFSVALIWLIIPLVLGIVALKTTKSAREAILLLASLAIMTCALIFYTTETDWNCLQSSRLMLNSAFSCAPTKIHGSIIVGCILFVSYLLFVEL